MENFCQRQAGGILSETRPLSEAPTSVERLWSHADSSVDGDRLPAQTPPLHILNYTIGVVLLPRMTLLRAPEAGGMVKHARGCMHMYV